MLLTVFDLAVDVTKAVCAWCATLRPLITELFFPTVQGGRRLFGYGCTFLVMIVRLALFSAALLPAWYQLIKYYAFSPQIKRGVSYGRRARNVLDIYRPAVSAHGSMAPVVIFFTGGAWTIGYKAWGALLGRALAAHGVLVFCPDYRNFPNGRVGDMLVDVDAAIAWVFEHAAEYGGDVSRITLCGQSAGAHLTAMTLLSHCDRSSTCDSGDRRFRASKETDVEPRGKSGQAKSIRVKSRQIKSRRRPSAELASVSSEQRLEGRDQGPGTRERHWTSADLASAVLISGPYDLVSLSPLMHSRGLSMAVLHAIFNTEAQEADGDHPYAAASAGVPYADPAAKVSRAQVSGRSTSSVREHLPPSSLLSAGDLDEAARRLRACSPTRVLDCLPPSTPATAAWAAYLPPLLLLHGTKDKTCPHEQSEAFHAALLRVGVQPERCVLKLYEGKTHTSPILEDPMGGTDLLASDLLDVVSGVPVSQGRSNAVQVGSRAMAPEACLRFASWVGPF